jgi:putative membrane protein
MIDRYSDQAANERTFLAWLRTGIAIVAFGFDPIGLDPTIDGIAVKPVARLALPYSH